MFAALPLQTIFHTIEDVRIWRFSCWLPVTGSVGHYGLVQSPRAVIWVVIATQTEKFPGVVARHDFDTALTLNGKRLLQYIPERAIVERKHWATILPCKGMALMIVHADITGVVFCVGFARLQRKTAAFAGSQFWRFLRHICFFLWPEFAAFFRDIGQAQIRVQTHILTGADHV